MSNLKKIEIPALSTAYAGRIFGSRYKARWAVFMDLAGVTYWYRKDPSFPRRRGGWEPDFYLAQGRYLHVTPRPWTPEDDLLARAFVAEGDEEGIHPSLTVLTGRIGVPTSEWEAPYTTTEYWLSDPAWFGKLPFEQRLDWLRTDHFDLWRQCRGCGDIEMASPVQGCFCGYYEQVLADGIEFPEPGTFRSAYTEQLREAYETAESIKLDSWANLRVSLA